MAGLAAARMSGGSEFHAAGPACEKARSPNLVHGRDVTYMYVLVAGSRSQASTCCCVAGCTDDVFEIRRASVSVYSVYDRAQFEVNTTADQQPVQHHQAWRDVVANVQLMNETCCSVLDALQWLEC